MIAELVDAGLDVARGRPQGVVRDHDPRAGRQGRTQVPRPVELGGAEFAPLASQFHRFTVLLFVQTSQTWPICRANGYVSAVSRWPVSQGAKYCSKYPRRVARCV